VNIDTIARPGICIFDSGVGGLSVLDALRRHLPNASLVYVGDVAFAPYGEGDAARVMERCQRIVGHLADLGARVIVVACNTATVLAIAALRQWPALTFVGVEPGVKPAAAATRTTRIAVMATPATAASERLLHLVDAFAPGVHVHIEPLAWRLPSSAAFSMHPNCMPYWHRDVKARAPPTSIPSRSDAHTTHSLQTRSGRWSETMSS
jgi:glutamate racemase